MLVGGAVGQQAKARAADHCHLGPVVRLLQQPLGGQLVVIEGAAAGKVRGQEEGGMEWIVKVEMTQIRSSLAAL